MLQARASEFTVVWLFNKTTPLCVFVGQERFLQQCSDHIKKNVSDLKVNPV